MNGCVMLQVSQASALSFISPKPYTLVHQPCTLHIKSYTPLSCTCTTHTDLPGSTGLLSPTQRVWLATVHTCLICQHQAGVKLANLKWGMVGQPNRPHPDSCSIPQPTLQAYPQQASGTIPHPDPYIIPLRPFNHTPSKPLAPYPTQTLESYPIRPFNHTPRG